MAIECCCLRMSSLHGYHLQKWSKVCFYNLHLPQHISSRLQIVPPAISFCWPFIASKITDDSQKCPSLLLSFETCSYFGKMGLKYQSNHKRNFVKEVKRQDVVKFLRGHDVVVGVRRVIQDKRYKLQLTEERWKKNSKRILADIKETKSKMREKMEEVVERENVWTIPNFLCVSRIAMSPVLGYFILEQNFPYALGLLTVAGITDLLDGWIARTFENQSSKIGSFLDPIADKILIATMFLTLTYAGIIPVPLTGLIITRDVVLVAAGFIIRYKSLPPPRTLNRYFDVTHATAQLTPTFISKVNTMVQLVTVACTLSATVFGFLEHPALHSLWYITAGTTVASFVSYILSKNTFKILKKKP